MPKKHVAKAGDCASSIAYENGFFHETVWNDPQNGALRAIRDPFVLMAGDVVTIPDKRIEPVPKPTGAFHRFRLKGVPEKLRLQLLLLGEPRANLAVKVVVDGAEHQLTTDEEGRIECWIRPNAAEGKLIVDEHEEYKLLLGRMTPPSDDSGALARLVNLGYLKTKEAEADVLKRALERFQEDEGLEITGKLDDPSRDQLRERFLI